MAIIAKIGQILNTPIGMSESRVERKRSQANASNPFSATSFKGNVLTADVFETKATSKNKLTYSAFVGSINDAFPTFRKGIESVVAFGNRMVQGVSAVCHKLHEIGNTEINIDFAGAGRSMRSSWDAMMNRHSASHLSNRYSESELGEMLRAELSMDVVG